MVDLLKTHDPYDLPAAVILERFLALGCAAVVSSMQREPFPQLGVTTEVHRDGQTLLVTISRDAETIGVQEVRTEPYPPE